MKVFMLCTIAIMGSVLPRIASQDIEAMTSQEWARASANWDQTMEAHRHRGNLSSGAGGSCSSDIRSSFPTCLQYQTNWCWATAVAELAHFYKPEDFPVIGNDCHGMECKIVGHKKSPSQPSECCSVGCSNADQLCCQGPLNNFMQGADCKDKCTWVPYTWEVNKSECGTSACQYIAGQSEDILEGIMWTTGKKHTAKTDGPLSQDQLDTLLAKGHPVIIGVFWTAGGGHALTLGGCTGSGMYYLHDPENLQGSYQILTYEQIVAYVPPKKKELVGKWMWTFSLEGDLPNATMSESEIAV